MSGNQEFWDGIAKRYAKSPVWNEDAYAHTLERVASYLRPNHRVLELGAGTGTTAIKLAPGVGAICASDLSPEMLKIARTRAEEAGVENLTTAQGSIETAPEGPFDVVMAMNLFHLAEDLEGAMAQVSARLPEGGLFISKTPCLKDATGFKWRAMLLAVPLAQLLRKAPPFVGKLRVSDMDSAVEAAGFEIIETGNFPANPPSHFIVARKRS